MNPIRKWVEAQKRLSDLFAAPDQAKPTCRPSVIVEKQEKPAYRLPCPHCGANERHDGYCGVC